MVDKSTVDYKAVFDRLKQYLNAKSDASIAKSLGISPQALFSFKKQNKFPSELLINYCFMNGLSVDWLLTGEYRSEAALIPDKTSDSSHESHIIKQFRERIDSLEAHNCNIQMDLHKVIRESNKQGILTKNSELPEEGCEAGRAKLLQTPQFLQFCDALIDLPPEKQHMALRAFLYAIKLIAKGMNKMHLTFK